jgi:hypothetical protein
MVDDIWKTYT